MGPPPQSGYGMAPQPPPQKSRTGLYVGIGCGCLVILGCIIGGVVLATGAGGLLGPGEEVISTPISLGQPFTLTYVQDGDQKYEAWLEVDVSYTAGYNLTGTILLSEGGAAFGQYTLNETGDGSPVTERSSSKRFNWASSSINGSGSASGTVSLFPLPARTANGQVTISGTVQATPGTTVNSIRLFVAKRS
jgi:hypothetical protein